MEMGLIGRPVEYQLRVAAKVQNPSNQIVDQVGKIAFSQSVNPGDYNRKNDIRPMARTILAGFGKRSEKYREAAVRNMNGMDSLGIGAAQVAVATGASGALSKVVQMITDELAAEPIDPISLESSKRLLELSWAISLAKNPDKSTTRPIHIIMGRKVEIPAPPFGTVSSDPFEFCYILSRIEGETAILQYDFCGADRDPYRLPDHLGRRSLNEWGG